VLQDYEEYLAVEKALLIELGLIEAETKEDWHCFTDHFKLNCVATVIVNDPLSMIVQLFHPVHDNIQWLLIANLTLQN